MHAMKGPYSSERSVALMIALELLNEIVKRDTQTPVAFGTSGRLGTTTLSHRVWIG